jgi:hypothetical protein
MFLHNLLNVLVQIANKIGLQKKKIAFFTTRAPITVIEKSFIAGQTRHIVARSIAT